MNFSSLTAGIMALVIGGTFFAGYETRTWQDQAAQLKSAKRADKIDRKAGAISTTIGVKAQAAQDGITAHTQALEASVHEHVTAQADHGCIVTRGFVRVLDAAGHMPQVPKAAPEPDGSAPAARAAPLGVFAEARNDVSAGDDTPSGVVLSSLASNVTENYGRANECIANFTALQDWVSAQAKNAGN